VQPQYTSQVVLQETQDLENIHCDSADDMHSEDEDVSTACDLPFGYELNSRRLLQRCASGIRYQEEELKTVHGKTPSRLLGIHYNIQLDAKTQRRKVMDAAMEVAAYLYKNDNHRIDQRLEVISKCLPFLFSFSAPLIDYPNPI